MARESRFDNSHITILGFACIIMFMMFTISSCTPVNEVPVDRTGTVIDSITTDSLYRRHLILNPVVLAFETEFPSNEIVKNIDIENSSDTLTIPIKSIKLKHGNKGFTLFSDSMQFVLTHKGILGNSKSIPIRFNAPYEGRFHDTLVINDWKNFFIPLTAIVNSGTVVWIEDIDFGSIPFGEVRDTIIRIHNYGNETAVISNLTLKGDDPSAFELVQQVNQSITLKPGNNIGIKIRSNSDTQNEEVQARLEADISYSGKGNVKRTAICKANVYVKNGIYVTDISMHHAKLGVVNEAWCTIVNNTSKACTISALLPYADNLTCNVLISGNVQGVNLEAGKKLAPFRMRITPKVNGLFAITIPFVIIGDSVIDTVCNINGRAD